MSAFGTLSFPPTTAFTPHQSDYAIHVWDIDLSADWQEIHMRTRLPESLEHRRRPRLFLLQTHVCAVDEEKKTLAFSARTANGRTAANTSGRKALNNVSRILTIALILRSTRTRHTVLYDHLQPSRTNHQPLSSEPSQTPEHSLQFDPQSNARPFHETKSNEGTHYFHAEETIRDRHNKNLIHGAALTELHGYPTSPPQSSFSNPHL